MNQRRNYNNKTKQENVESILKHKAKESAKQSKSIPLSIVDKEVLSKYFNKKKETFDGTYLPKEVQQLLKTKRYFDKFGRVVIKKETAPEEPTPVVLPSAPEAPTPVVLPSAPEAPTPVVLPSAPKAPTPVVLPSAPEAPTPVVLPSAPKAPTPVVLPSAPEGPEVPEAPTPVVLPSAPEGPEVPEALTPFGLPSAPEAIETPFSLVFEEVHPTKSDKPIVPGATGVSSRATGEIVETLEPVPTTTQPRRELIGSFYTDDSQEGDFLWMKDQRKYQNALFIFNDNVQDMNKSTPGGGNAQMRQFNQFSRTIPPKSAGIPTGWKPGRKEYGFTSLNDIRFGSKFPPSYFIDIAIARIEKLLKQYDFGQVIYSSESRESNNLGSKTFNIGGEVKDYILQELNRVVRDTLGPSEVSSQPLVRSAPPRFKIKTKEEHLSTLKKSILENDCSNSDPSLDGTVLNATKESVARYLSGNFNQKIKYKSDTGQTETGILKDVLLTDSEKIELARLVRILENIKKRPSSRSRDEYKEFYRELIVPFCDFVSRLGTVPSPAHTDTPGPSEVSSQPQVIEPTHTIQEPLTLLAQVGGINIYATNSKDNLSYNTLTWFLVIEECRLPCELHSEESRYNLKLPVIDDNGFTLDFERGQYVYNGNLVPFTSIFASITDKVFEILSMNRFISNILLYEIDFDAAQKEKIRKLIVDIVSNRQAFLQSLKEIFTSGDIEEPLALCRGVIEGPEQRRREQNDVMNFIDFIFINLRKYGGFNSTVSDKTYSQNEQWLNKICTDFPIDPLYYLFGVATIIQPAVGDDKYNLSTKMLLSFDDDDFEEEYYGDEDEGWEELKMVSSINTLFKKNQLLGTQQIPLSKYLLVQLGLQISLKSAEKYVFSSANLPLENLIIGEKQYMLIGIVMHVGEKFESGHFKNYIWFGQDYWVCENDDKITNLDYATLINELSYSDNGQPYLLLYQAITQSFIDDIDCKPHTFFTNYQHELSLAQPLSLNNPGPHQTKCYVNSAVQLLRRIPELKILLDHIEEYNELTGDTVVEMLGGSSSKRLPITYQLTQNHHFPSKFH